MTLISTTVQRCSYTYLPYMSKYRSSVLNDFLLTLVVANRQDDANPKTLPEAFPAVSLACAACAGTELFAISSHESALRVFKRDRKQRSKSS
jgi:hypothetical protein